MPQARRKTSIVVRAVQSIVLFLVGTVGVNLQGAEVLEVRGRTTGQPRRVPVNPVTMGTERYLLSPRGETSWVRNIRVAGEGSLRRGRRWREFRIEEMPDDEKVPILRTYLARWHWQVGGIMQVARDASDAELREIAPRHPVFRIVPGQGKAG